MDERAGSGEFELWYGDHYRRLVAAMYLVTGDRSAAVEAVDEAFARAFERWSRVREMQSPAGWTWVVAGNALRATHRADRRRTDAHRRSPHPGSTPPPEMQFEVWDAVRRLPRREREVIALRYLGDLQEKEIAESLGIAPGTVARALHDARRSLGDMLRDGSPSEERHD